MGDIILIKPVSSDFREQNRLLGNLDIPVSELGESDLEKLISLVRDNDLDTIYSSSSNPCKATSEKIADELDITLKEKNSLNNINLGLWQGLQIDEIRRKQPKVFKQWIEKPETIRPPEGESVDEVVKRVTKTISKIKKRKGRTGIIVSEPLASLIKSILQETDITFQTLIHENPELSVEQVYPVPETQKPQNGAHQVDNVEIKKEGEDS